MRAEDIEQVEKETYSISSIILRAGSGKSSNRVDLVMGAVEVEVAFWF